ncbi:MAG TPA: acyl-CoA dehydrogenase family protein [Candidatus Limnocylindrales bacterium]|nr:acyl-CoA dehydrogenase family protein [Candidatus Limnocylindrales bacterium]
MNFELTDEQKMMVDAVRRFVDNDSPISRFRNLRTTEAGYEAKTWKAMADYGWLAVAFPEEQGGYGGNFVDVALILEQLGRGLVPEPYIASVVLAGGLLSRLGTPQQIERFLAPMLEGRTTLAFAYAERQARYEAADCQTKAVKSASGYTLTGEKVWVLNGHAADAFVVVARTSGGPRDAAGLSLFLVDGDAPGLERVRVHGMDGQSTGLVRLSSVEVGADRLLGSEGHALADIEWALDRGAAAACAEAQGGLGALLAMTVDYLKQRKQFGKAIGSFQALQHRAADMFAEVELCRGMMIFAAIHADSGDEAGRKAAISAAKVQLQQGGWFVQENAVQLFGGIAITDEQDVGLYFKRIRVLQSLFGDADWHLGRYASQPGFDGAAAG